MNAENFDSSTLLHIGDVIELQAGMAVYADVPKHFLYQNCHGDFSISHGLITLGDQFDYLCGKYIVTNAYMDGGGNSSDGEFPDGWHVFCMKADDRNVKVDFYQSGCFTAMISSDDIEPVGTAIMDWTIEE